MFARDCLLVAGNSTSNKLKLKKPLNIDIVIDIVIDISGLSKIRLS